MQQVANNTDVRLRYCGSAESARLMTYSDGNAFVEYRWSDGQTRTLPYVDAEEALGSLRSMGFGGAA